MASNNPVGFKVFIKNENCKEVKRFVVDDGSVVTNFLFMKEKLKYVFPDLRDVSFRMTWKDMDGDEITIDSDEDLITAFTEMSGPLKVLYVTILDRNPEEVVFDMPMMNDRQHPFSANIICDVCEKKITGYRYKCLQCLDYDLCVECEYRGNHPEHMMLRTSKSYPIGRCAKKFFDQINRSVKKVNHMAYKEACNAGRYKRRSERHDERKKHNDERTDASKTEDENETGCPMQNMNFEHLTPMIYPFLDALNTQMQNAPASAAAASAAAAAPSSNEQGSSNEQNKNANPQINPLADMIKNAISGFFDMTHTGQPSQSQNVPTTSSAGSPPQQATPQNIPMEVEKEIDLTKSPNNGELPRREPGWTMLFPEADKPENRPPASAPNDENAKIADGLKQLLDMGFTDQVGLVALLKRFDGNVGQVVKYIFENNV